MAESIGEGEQQDLSALGATGLLRKIVMFRSDLESVRLDTIGKLGQQKKTTPPQTALDGQPGDGVSSESQGSPPEG